MICPMTSGHDRIIILDFGSQYTQLIARRIREFNVYSEIRPPTVGAAELRAMKPSGIILSGGPASLEEEGAPNCDPGMFDLQIPILGICYGFQLIAKRFGGSLRRHSRREFGPAVIRILEKSGPFAAFPKGSEHKVWMSHGDAVDSLPPDYVALATATDGVIAAAAHTRLPIYGLQFHPEVVHTAIGKDLLKEFLFGACKVHGDWTMRRFVDSAVESIRATVGSGRVICGLSGGVDSSVVALLLHRAIGDRLQCIFVDNGLLRLGERRQVEEVFSGMFEVPLLTIDARERFLARLRNVVDPEAKRKAIGAEFIAVFEEAAAKFTDAAFLAQGTLYPDVIESVSVHGPSATIKSHHNVGGLPKGMKLKLVEPVRELFKDEVRQLGRELGLPDALVDRHPFPGPGLAIRVISEVTDARLERLRKADAIFLEELHRGGVSKAVWQAFAVLLPVNTVGVMGDERTYENVCALRAVTSVDGMTADWARLPYEVLARASARIANEVQGINRVVYDVSSKPPATIEWE